MYAAAFVLPLLAAAPALAQEADQTDEEIPESGPPSLPAPTDTLLPRTGIDTTAETDLRSHLLSAYGEPEPGGEAPKPGLQILKQIGVSETYTDNAGYNLGGVQDVGYDFITSIQPSIRVIDNTRRLLIYLNYSPIGLIYARNSNFSQIEQQFNGDILLTALPDWAYVDVRGSVIEQSVFGGIGPSSTVFLSPNDRETVSSVAISPYLSHKFGGAGTLQAGLGYSYSAVDASNAFNQAFGSPATGFGNYGSAYLNTERVFASWTTGENWGRLRNRIGTDDSFFQGSGALANAHRILVTDDASYAATRLVSLLGEIGYENLSYPAASFAYRGPIGAAGVELTPRPNSQAVIEYRYLDGFGSLFVQGSIQATPRIRVFGGYSEGISTFQQDLQTTLLSTGSDLTGAQAAAFIASPLLQGTNFFGANEQLSRIRRIDATATYLGNRDIVTATVQEERTTPVGRPIDGLLPISTEGWFVSGSERHELTPTLSLSAYLQYGENRIAVLDAGTGNTLSFALSLDKIFTETLSGYLRVSGSYVIGGSAFGATGVEGTGGEETSVTVGGVKKF